MDDELYKIAQHNLKIRRRTGIVAVISTIIFLSLLIYATRLEEAPILLLVLAFGQIFVALWYIFKEERKIIGRKTALDLEVERLKKQGVTKEDAEELELKQIVKRYNDDELV